MHSGVQRLTDSHVTKTNLARAHGVRAPCGAAGEATPRSFYEPNGCDHSGELKKERMASVQLH